METGGRRRAAIGLGVLVIVAAGLAGYQVLVAEPGTDLVSYHDVSPPSAPRAESSEVQDRLSRASELVDFNSGDFAGAYLASGSEVVVVAASDRGEDLADAEFGDDPGVTVSRAPFSLDAVSEFGDELVESDQGLADKVLLWMIEPATAALQIDFFQALDEDEREIVESFADEHSLTIEVYLDEGAERPSLSAPS